LVILDENQFYLTIHLGDRKEVGPMARDRERICEFYIKKGECTKGRNAEFRGICQTCAKYRAKAGSAPARTDRRRSKMEKIQKKERWDY